MATKHSLKGWIVEALNEAEGILHHVRIAEYIWLHYEQDLRDSGDLFYTWQYDLRWAAQNLRKEGILAPIDGNAHGDGLWRLSQRRRAEE